LSQYPRIFLSHSKRDNDWCRQFAHTLQSAGLDVWIDEKGLSGGAQWVAEIERQLQSRELFLVVISPDAWVSDWVQEEIQLALAKRKQMLPVLYKAAEVEGFLLNRQWVDVRGLDAAAAAERVLRELGVPLPQAPGQQTKVSEGLANTEPVRLNAPIIYRGQEAQVSSVAWSPAGARIASGSLDGSIQIWYPGQGDTPLVAWTHGDGVHEVAWSPDGAHLASAGSDGILKVWGATSGECLLTCAHMPLQLRSSKEPKPQRVTSVAWSPDGRHIASGGDSYEVQGMNYSPTRIWDATTGKLALALGTGPIAGWRSSSPVRWSPDGSRIATPCTADKYARGISLWNATTGAELSVLGRGSIFSDSGNRGYLGPFSWSPDGRWLASGDSNGVISLWSGAGGSRPAVKFRCKNGSYWEPKPTSALAWSTDSQHLAVGIQGRVEVWSVAAQPQCAYLYEGHLQVGDSSPYIYALSWSPKSNLVASVCNNGTVHIWPFG
jgi:WD40 repeat protein